ncbi:MAG: efflux RND transporter periplasmic adaptor subunit [Campylobacterales bacterium]
MIVALIVALIGAGGAWMVVGQKKSEEKVEEFVVTEGPISQTIEATGVIKPGVGAEVKVGARATGIVISEKVKVGDLVKKGDLIALIDARETREQVGSARAALEEVRTTCPAQIEVEQKKLISAQESLANARSNLEYAQWDYERKEKLYNHPRKLIPEEEFRKAKNALDNAKTAFTNARIAQETQEILLENTRRSCASREAQARAALAQHTIKEGYSRIEAPIGGIVSFVSTQEGETVVAGLNAPEFVKILDLSRLENRIYIDETEIGLIKTGQKVIFTLDAYPGKQFEGKIVQIYPTPILQNNVVYFIAVATGFNDAHLLRPEMTTHNKVIVRSIKRTLLLPAKAIKWHEGRFVVTKKGADGQEEEVEVKTGVSEGGMTQILSGLKAGDKVIVRTTQTKPKPQ